MVLVCSPVCTAFSTWQRINNLIRDPVIVAAKKKRGIVHLEFCAELYRKQMKHGRYFVHACSVCHVLAGGIGGEVAGGTWSRKGNIRPVSLRKRC